MAFAFSIALWDFADYNFRIAPTYQSAFWWSVVFPIAIPLSVPTLYFFVLALTEKKNLFDHWFSSVWVVGGTVILIFSGILAAIFDSQVTLGAMSWEVGPGSSLISLFTDNGLILWGAVTLLATLTIIISYAKRLYDPLKKNQLTIMFWGIIVSNLADIGSALLWYGGFQLPDWILSILAVGSAVSVPLLISIFAYAIIRFDMFAINTATAAEMIFETMSDGVLLLDASRRIVLVNNAARTLFGFTTNSALGMDIEQVLRFDRAWSQEAMMSTLIHQGRFADIEAVVIPSSIPVSLSGAFIDAQRGVSRGIVCIARDITERKRHEQAVRRELTKLQLIIESVGEGMLVVDNSHTVLLANERAREIISQKDLVGDSFFDIFSLVTEKNDSFDLRQKVNEVLVHNREYRIPFTDRLYLRINESKKMPITVTITALKLDHAAEGFIVMFEDVTREMEIDAAKSSFVSLAAHQLRTPSTAVNWGLEALEEDIIEKLTPDLQEMFRTIKRSALSMSDLITQFLNVSRIEMGRLTVNPENVLLSDIVSEVIEEQKMHSQLKSQKFAVKMSRDIPPLPLDRVLTKMIVQNLVSNAIKYTPEKGKISVILAYHNPVVELSVADTGIGIPKAQLSQLFSKLFRADNAVKSGIEGNGLGLYVVREIVRLADGNIACHSVEGKGSTFTVTIPLHGMKYKKGSVTLE